MNIELCATRKAMLRIVLLAILILAAYPALAQRGAAPNEVIVFEHPNFVGRSQSFRIESGMRHRLVPKPSMPISSILVGSGVKAWVWENPQWRGTVKEIGNDTAHFRPPVSSLVVVPKHSSYQKDIYRHAVLGEKVGLEVGFSHFFLPEKILQGQGKYPNIGVKINNLTFDTRYASLTLYEKPNFRGANLRLPGMYEKEWGIKTYQLVQYQWHKTSSLIIGASARPKFETGGLPPGAKPSAPSQPKPEPGTTSPTPPPPKPPAKTSPPLGQKQVAPNEVILFSELDYLGVARSYKLDSRTMRHKLVPVLLSSEAPSPGKIGRLEFKAKSMLIGSEVKVLFFDRPYFLGGKMFEMSAVFGQGPKKPKVTEIRSFVILPKDANTRSHGVLCSRKASSGLARRLGINTIWYFFPLPEHRGQSLAKYREVSKGLSKAKDVIVQFDSRYVRVAIHRDAKFRGKSLFLPGQYGSKNQYNLADYDMRVGSLMVDTPSRPPAQ